MNKKFLSALILIFFSFLGSCKSNISVDLSILEQTLNFEVFAYEPTGKRMVTNFQKPSEVEKILSFLISGNFKLNSSPSKITPPTESALFKDASGNSLYTIWFGADWVGSQEESKDFGAKIWRVKKSKINTIRSIFTLKNV